MVEARNRIIPTIDITCIDNHLRGILEACRQLTKEWKCQRHKELRNRIVALNAKAAAYVNDLAKETWLKICDVVSGRLFLKHTHNLLCHLIDPAKGKLWARGGLSALSMPTRAPIKLVDNLATLCLGCSTRTPKTPHSDYRGRSNTTPNEPISMQELKEALASNNKDSVPGPDSLTYKPLANLEPTGFESLFHHMNQAWEQDYIPKEWKHSSVSFTQMPGKPLTFRKPETSLSHFLREKVNRESYTRPTASLHRRDNAIPTQYD